jgi:hypothetical protein
MKKLAIPVMALTVAGINCLAASIPVSVTVTAPGVTVSAGVNVGTILGTVLSTVTGLLGIL